MVAISFGAVAELASLLARQGVGADGAVSPLAHGVICAGAGGLSVGTLGSALLVDGVPAAKIGRLAGGGGTISVASIAADFINVIPDTLGVQVAVDAVGVDEGTLAATGIVGAPQAHGVESAHGLAVMKETVLATGAGLGVPHAETR